MAAKVYAFDDGGYVSVKQTANGCDVLFSLPELDAGDYTCLCYEGTLHNCGNVQGGAKRMLHCRLEIPGIRPAFAVCDKEKCVLFTGNAQGRGFIEHYLRQNSTAQTFYEQNAAYFDKLFAGGTPLTDLEQLLPSCRVVSVPSPQGDCAVGIVYDEAHQPLYILYGIAGQSNEQPPEDIRPYCRWLLTDITTGAGYWVIYQSVMDGHAISQE